MGSDMLSPPSGPFCGRETPERLPSASSCLEAPAWVCVVPRRKVPNVSHRQRGSQRSAQEGAAGGRAVGPAGASG